MVKLHTIRVAFSASVFVSLIGCGSDQPAQLAQPGTNFAAVCGSGRPQAATPYVPVKGDLTSTTAKWYAIDGLLLGSRDIKNGARTSTAWQCYGFDLDGRATAAESTNGQATCKRREGTRSWILADGADGIDNNFGREIVPLLGALDRCFDEPSLGNAPFALMLRIDGTAEREAAHLPGALYLVATGAQPLALVPSTGVKPILEFPDAYVVDGTWVSGPPSTKEIALPLQVGFELFGGWLGSGECPKQGILNLPAKNLIMSTRLDGGSVGMIGGAMPVASLRKSIDTWLGGYGVCRGGPVERMVSDAILENADFALGGPDPDRECDAVSFGIGFTMKSTPAPAVTFPWEPQPNDLCSTPIIPIVVPPHTSQVDAGTTTTTPVVNAPNVPAPPPCEDCPIVPGNPGNPTK
ncbi:MAG: hypothetical protein ACXVEE_16880 [Polyangiales bacterium]